MKIAKHRALLPAALAALLASPALAQTVPGSGAKAPPKYFVSYSVRALGGTATLTILDDGSVLLAERGRGRVKTTLGRLEPQELAGLAAALDPLLRGRKTLPAIGSAKRVDRVLTVFRGGLRHPYSVDALGTAAKPVADWLEDLKRMAKAGALAPAAPVLRSGRGGGVVHAAAAKQPHRDRGPVHAAAAKQPRAVIRPVAGASGFVIDAKGRRRMLTAPELETAAAAGILPFSKTRLADRDRDLVFRF
jgi:hypothetical protein